MAGNDYSKAPGRSAMLDRSIIWYAAEVKNRHAVALGRLGGLKGGPARARALQRSQRQAISRRAAAARWQGALPEILRPLFWQGRLEDVNLVDHVDHVLLQVLANGDGRQIHWLRRRLGDDRIRKWIVARKGKGLSRMQMLRWVPWRVSSDWQERDAYARMWEQR
jgi:hypothetical protein